MQTDFTRLLKIKYPVVQAPIGSVTTPELAAAVSNAGGLGMLALTWKSPDETKAAIKKTKTLTQRPFGVNLVPAFNIQEKVNICIEERVPIVSFFWGDPESYIEPLKKVSTMVCVTAASASEALKYEQMGIEFLIAQCWEAGGHVAGQTAMSVLISAIVDKVKIPVVASGGIANGKGMLAALTLGASGVCLGTRFLMTHESAANSFYKRMIADASDTSTVYTRRLFNIGWDHAPHRIIQNSTWKQWVDAGEPEPGNRPNEYETVARNAKGEDIVRYSDASPLIGVTGNLETLALYAGQSAGLISDVKTAATVIEDLMTELKQANRKVQQLLSPDNHPRQ